MKDISIGKNLIKLRKEMQITQEQLADYIGVSKAAVSKWETELNFPDVSLLPLLASYFNVTIDTLMGYEAQLSRHDVCLLYARLSKRFAQDDFNEVVKECREVTKNYYSCYYAVLNIATLYINHGVLADDEKQVMEIYKEARTLLQHVRKHSDELEDRNGALELEAYCDLILHEPKEAIQILEGIKRGGSNTLLANAYLMDQNTDRAEVTLEVDIFQSIMMIFDDYASFLTLQTKDKERFEIALHQIFMMDTLFEVRKMSPGVVLPIYLVAIQGYIAFQDFDKAIILLEEYEQLLLEDIKTFELNGAGLLSRIHEWMDKQQQDVRLPRDEKVIKESAINAILLNPVFLSLRDEPRFLNICTKLKESLEGK